MAAKKKTTTKKKRSKAGAPTKYRPKYHPKMAELAAQVGFTDTEISKQLKISYATLNNWKNEHPEFLDSIRRGKDKADDEVVNALRKNALGYEETEEKVFCSQGMLLKAEIKKIHKPETNAATFWLRNRKSLDWRDKVHVEDDTDYTDQFEKAREIAATFAKKINKE